MLSQRCPRSADYAERGNLYKGTPRTASCVGRIRGDTSPRRSVREALIAAQAQSNMVLLLPCPLSAAEEACAASFSGRLSFRGCAASGTSGHGAVFGGAPRRRRPFFAAPNGCRAMDARYDAGQISAHERPGSDLQSAAKLRLHALISRVQG